MVVRKLEKPKYEVVGDLQRFDEADNVQARGELVPESELWQRYYREHPEFEKQDRVWATLPRMGRVIPSQDILMVAAIPWAINLMSRDEHVDGEPSPERTIVEPELASEKVKGFARHLGADLVRIGPLNPAWVYSHVGRSHFPETIIGTPINLPHRNAIVVAIHLNRDMVKQAPQLPVILETMKTYLQLSSIVVTLGRYIRSLGYSARGHDLWNYQVLLVPIAIDAGLGEVARNGVLITEEYGSAIKMAAVTTDMPLVHDRPVDIGVDEFCNQCTLCAEYCPVGAIPKGDKSTVRGVRKWILNDSACYSSWRRFGSDCGVCLAVCPWTRPRIFPHNLVLWGVERSILARRLAIKADTILGRRKKVELPEWLK